MCQEWPSAMAFLDSTRPEQPGRETWAGESWQTGGRRRRFTGSFDPELNTVYWGTGNPAPDYDGDARKGDNLYSDSLVALDADTGKLRWHFQFTPHDFTIGILRTFRCWSMLPFRRKPRKLVLVANRNGFYYVLDRVTGEFIRGTQCGKQTWASGLDAKGRPIRLPDTAPARGPYDLSGFSRSH